MPPQGMEENQQACPAGPLDGSGGAIGPAEVARGAGNHRLPSPRGRGIKDASVDNELTSLVDIGLHLAAELGMLNRTYWKRTPGEQGRDSLAAPA